MVQAHDCRFVCIGHNTCGLQCMHQACVDCLAAFSVCPLPFAPFPVTTTTTDVGPCGSPGTHPHSPPHASLPHTDMGPRSRCLNSDAPPAQPFQLPLPDAPERLADFEAVRQEVRRALRTRHQALPGDTDASGQPYYGERQWACSTKLYCTRGQGCGVGNTDASGQPYSGERHHWGVWMGNANELHPWPAWLTWTPYTCSTFMP